MAWEDMGLADPRAMQVANVTRDSGAVRIRLVCTGIRTDGTPGPPVRSDVLLNR